MDAEDARFLKQMGVDERFVEAVERSYGKILNGFEFLPDKDDPKLMVRCSKSSQTKPQVITIHISIQRTKALQLFESQVKYRDKNYLCQDVLEFIPYGQNGTENLKINGQKLRLSQALLKLLLHFAKELKENPEGWVYVQDLRDRNVTPVNVYQQVSRLRNSIGGYLLEMNPKDLIETNGMKQYRLSTHPDNIFLAE